MSLFIVSDDNTEQTTHHLSDMVYMNNIHDNIEAPFASAVSVYIDAGWPAVIPVDVNRTGAVVRGYTGAKNYANFPPSPEKYAEWYRTHGTCNVGLWLPRDIIGIDVDDYNDRGGARTIDFIEYNIAHVPLPDTWTTTSRGMHQPSRIHLFRLPFTARDDRWVSKNGGVDIVRFGHRYVRCWPSRKSDTGSVYRWYYPDGSVAAHGVVPRPEDLAELPPEWLPGFRKPPRCVRVNTTGIVISGTGANDGAGISLDTHSDDVEQSAAFSEMPRDDMNIEDIVRWASRLHVDTEDAARVTCPKLRAMLERAVESLELGNGRHDTALDALWAIINEGASGHVGALPAVDHLYDTFISSTCRDGSRTHDSARGEWFRLLVGAVERVAAVIPAPDVVPRCSCALHAVWAARILSAHTQ